MGLTKIPVLVVFISLFFVGAAFATVINDLTCPSGLVAYWNLDEASGTKAMDASGVNVGTLTNGPVWTTGQVGNAVQFDGVDDRVVIPNNANLNPTSQISIDYWVNAPSYTSYGQMISKVYSSQWGVMWYGGTGKIRCDIAPLVGYGLPLGEFFSNTVLSLNQWHHVVCTYDGANVKIYIDGALDKTSASVSGNIYTSTNPLVLGELNPTGTAMPFKGMMDEVQIYNRALSASEIQHQYNLGLQGKTVCEFTDASTSALDGTVWVANRGSNTVSKISTTNNAIISTISLDKGPFGIAVDANSIWITNFDIDNVTRISKRTLGIATISLSNSSRPAGIAADNDSVWVAGYVSGNVSRINKSTNAVIANIAVTGPGLNGIAVDNDSVWVTHISGRVYRISKSTLTVTRTFTFSGRVEDVTLDQDSVWVTNEGGTGTISKINKTTNTVTTINTGLPHPAGIAVDDGSVWVVNDYSPDTVARINKTTNAIIALIPVVHESYGIALEQNSVWITSGISITNGTISRINKATNAITVNITVGKAPYNLGDATGYAYDFLYPATCTNGVTRPCPIQQGVCAGSFETCTASKWPGCDYSTIPSFSTSELCDGLDNNCNGLVDENYTVHTCGVGACLRNSACVGGTESCVEGAPSAENSVATCWDSLDNNCNGLTDKADTGCAPGVTLPSCTLAQMLDLNGDGTVNVNDAIFILRAVVGLPNAVSSPNKGCVAVPVRVG